MLRELDEFIQNNQDDIIVTGGKMRWQGMWKNFSWIWRKK